MKKNQIKHNEKIHDKLFKTYNLKHSEIYNKFEQKRLSEVVNNIVESTRKNEPKVLDVGAGTGNLSLKFLKLKCEVTASDVSKNSLFLLRELSGNNNYLKLAIIKNKELPFKDNQFDIVCTYSVLHHIPDYEFTVQEMIRVTKPGGFIYIDHEANENKWKLDSYLKEYYRKTKQTKIEHLIKLIKTKELFTFDFIKTVFIKLLVNKRYQREGDIHVWHDDHIDWRKIFNLIKKNNCELFEKTDYLMYKPKGGMQLYNSFKNKCTDTKYVIVKKNG